MSPPSFFFLELPKKRSRAAATATHHLRVCFPGEDSLRVPRSVEKRQGQKGITMNNIYQEEAENGEEDKKNRGGGAAADDGAAAGQVPARRGER